MLLFKGLCNMKYLNRSGITVFKTTAFLQWVRHNHPNLAHWDLSSLNHHPNVYLFDLEDQNCWGNCFEEHFNKIFQHEIEDFIRHEFEYPNDVTFESHNTWLSFEYAELVCDLSNQHLKVYDD